ncbi:hypothetical protein A4X03_0g8521 [Tilletia caries]|uniref:Uncharacterized protein n=1 Tax=Tilletia caries TaxID=13290 RepID=A0A8T8SHN7_9BASI|nr:hypothetical protein A4X03_0g8521 [Tilletia caries]
MAPLFPSPNAAYPSPEPRWDHAFISEELALSTPCRLSYLMPDFETDYLALLLALPLPDASFPAAPSSSSASGLLRPSLAKLRQDASVCALRAAYRAQAPSISSALSLAEERAAAGPLTSAQMQDLIDCADGIFHDLMMRSAFCALGSYDASTIRSAPDKERQRLVEEANHDQTASLRLWKRAQRGRVRLPVASDEGVEAGMSAEEEARSVWGTQWNSDGEKDEPPQGLDLDTPRLVDVSSPSLAGEFSDLAVLTALKRYPRHKSGGEDGDHAAMFHALASDCLEARPPTPATTPPPTLPSSSAPAQGHSLRLPRKAQSQPLNARAAPFVPLSVRTDQGTEEVFPFVRHLSRLLRLVAACAVTPARWGRALVHLIPKRADGDPTAATSRPIGLLPMFRRIFEAIFVKRLNPERSWAQLHAGQAGLCSSYKFSPTEARHSRNSVWYGRF